MQESYPTWIRTKTSRTRICGTTVILSGNLASVIEKADCKNKIITECYKIKGALNINLKIQAAKMPDDLHFWSV